jgi:hypothetical protein
MPLVAIEGFPLQVVESGEPRFGDLGEDGGAASWVYPVAAVDLGFLPSQPLLGVDLAAETFRNLASVWRVVAGPPRFRSVYPIYGTHLVPYLCLERSQM